MTTLLYHAHQGTDTSPFDEAVLKVSQGGDVRIVSPYIGVSYLERIISVSPKWRLVSDVQEWLASLSTQARPRAWAFIRENLPLIHHCTSLHAKAVIGDGLAMLGSANLTNKGILGRTEMGVLLDDPRLVAELGAWFEDLWSSTAPPSADEASSYVQWLDTEAQQAPSRRQRVTLSSNSRKVRAHLVKLDAPKSPAAPEIGPLDLGAVARTLIVQDQARYDSLDAALDAALDRLTASFEFGFGDVVAVVHEGFAGASLREIYFLLLQHCANHVRSIFAETTQNRLVLTDGRFSQSSIEALKPALVPFDALLAYLISRLSARDAQALPSEEQVEHDTGIAGRDFVILVSELLECGLLLLDDVPGALPHYSLDPEFEWEGRYRLFSRARAAWLNRLREDATHAISEGDALPEDFDEPDDEFIDVNADLLPEYAENSDASYDEAVLDRELRAANEASRQRQLAEASAAERKVKRKLEQIDRLLERLLGVVLDGQVFTGASQRSVAQAVSKAMGADRDIAAQAIGTKTQVFKVVRALSGTDYRLEINDGLTIEMLVDYPRARTACEKLLGQSQS